jgi:DNA (cytosine-5)-methyltransferase 1
LALFAGAGGGILGGHLLGWKTVCAVEWADYPRRVLLARQRDGILPRFPIWDDVQTFDGRPWKGRVDIITGGFPCQDISAAGKGAGIDGERSGMWKHMARIINEVRPRFAFVENSPMLTSRGLGTVLGDLAEMGYDARWCVLGASDAGAPHRRERIWVLAYTSKQGLERVKWEKYERPGNRLADSGKNNLAYTGCEHGGPGDAARMDTDTEIRTASSVHDKPSSAGQVVNPDSERQQKQHHAAESDKQIKHYWGNSKGWWDSDPADGPVESRLGRVAHGVANRVDRLKAIGNGQVPAVAAIAFAILSEGLI